MCPELYSELAFFNIQRDLLQGLLEFLMIQTNQYFSSILKQLFDLSDRISNGAQHQLSVSQPKNRATMEKIELGLSFSIKVVNEKSRGEVSLMEQETIENVSQPIKN